MEGRVFKYFWHTRMAGVVEHPCGIDRIYHFANVEVEHGDILEYDVDGTPITAWSKLTAPAEILQEAKRQEDARRTEREREHDLWRSKNSSARSEDT